MNFFLRITWSLNYGGKKFHAEIPLPDFSIIFLLSAKRAAYTRDLRVFKKPHISQFPAGFELRFAGKGLADFPESRVQGTLFARDGKLLEKSRSKISL